MPNDRHSEQQDRELIERIVKQDHQALDEFYTRYNRVAFGLVLRIVGSREDAEDVLVDAFWQVWRQASRYDGSRGTPVAWLLTIARSRAIDCLRSRSRQPGRADDNEPPKDFVSTGSKPDEFVLADTRQAVVQAVNALSDQERIPLEMAYFQGMSHTEIAAALNQPLGTTKDRIRTGMAHLRKRLQAYL